MRTLHLNNQIWIKTRSVSDHTDIMNCSVYLHIHKRPTSPFKIKMPLGTARQMSRPFSFH